MGVGGLFFFFSPPQTADMIIIIFLLHHLWPTCSSAQQDFLAAAHSPFVTPATSLIQECNPAEAAGSATAIVTDDEYFIELHQAH